MVAKTVTSVTAISPPKEAVNDIPVTSTTETGSTFPKLPVSEVPVTSAKVFASEIADPTAVCSNPAVVTIGPTSLTGSLGNVDPVSVVDVTGISLTASLGGEIVVTDVTVGVTTAGLLQGAIGNVDAVSSVELVGLLLNTSIGSATTVQTANVFPTGISMNTNVGNVAVTPWSEVDLDVNNTWTEVDLAA